MGVAPSAFAALRAIDFAILARLLLTAPSARQLYRLPVGSGQTNINIINGRRRSASPRYWIDHHRSRAQGS